MDLSVLIVPGIGNSDAHHWQTLWQKKHPHWQRLDVANWDEVTCSTWVEAIDRQCTALGPNPLIVAHSLGCLAVAHWAAQTSGSRKIRGALLVALPDPESPAFPATSTFGFSHTPSTAFPFPCLVAASSNDPYANLEYTRKWADTRGASWVNMGAQGHLSSVNGLGDWPEGYQLLLGLARN